MLIYLQMLECEEDKDKFEQIYLRYRGLMFHVAMQILQQEQDAEDVVHQAFLAVLKHLKKISRVECPKTRAFVVIIVERKAIDRLRERNRAAGLPFEEWMSGTEIPLPGDCGLADAMACLPIRYREVLLLRYDNGYSCREIASMLGMGHSAVQKLLWRAKRSLEEVLEDGSGKVKV